MIINHLYINNMSLYKKIDVPTVKDSIVESVKVVRFNDTIVEVIIP